MREKIISYCDASCGMGNYFPNRLVLLRKLRQTRRPTWAGIPVPEFITILTNLIEQDGIKATEEAVK
jgi:hypothetical protein